MGMVNYANDFQDNITSFSWRAGVTPTEDADLQESEDDLQAAANQLVHLLRFKDKRADINPMARLLPNVNYSHSCSATKWRTRFRTG
jgi:hypothetical protein